MLFLPASPAVSSVAVSDARSPSFSRLGPAPEIMVGAGTFSPPPCSSACVQSDVWSVGTEWPPSAVLPGLEVLSFTSASPAAPSVFVSNALSASFSRRGPVGGAGFSGSVPLGIKFGGMTKMLGVTRR